MIKIFTMFALFFLLVIAHAEVVMIPQNFDRTLIIEDEIDLKRRPPPEVVMAPKNFTGTVYVAEVIDAPRPRPQPLPQQEVVFVEDIKQEVISRPRPRPQSRPRPRPRPRPMERPIVVEVVEYEEVERPGPQWQLEDGGDYYEIEKVDKNVKVDKIEKVGEPQLLQEPTNAAGDVSLCAIVISVTAVLAVGFVM